jgi:hypothetical protein
MSAPEGPDVLTHEQASAELAAVALDALPEAERARVLAHAAQCELCQRELRSLSAAAGALAEAFDPTPEELAAAGDLGRVRSRVLARVAGDRAARGAAPPDAASTAIPAGPRLVRDEEARPAALRPLDTLRPAAREATTVRATPRRTFGGTGWLAIAAGLAFVAAAAGLARVTSERNQLREQLGAAAAARSAAEDARRRLAADVEDRDRLIAQLTGPKVRVVELASTRTRAPSGRMFWDQAANAWTFVAHDLPTPATGRTYQLWVIARERGVTSYVSAGTFTPRADGTAIVRATYPLAPNALAAIGVTEEPAGGSPQPTSAPFIAGNATE